MQRDVSLGRRRAAWQRPCGPPVSLFPGRPGSPHSREVVGGSLGAMSGALRGRRVLFGVPERYPSLFGSGFPLDHQLPECLHLSRKGPSQLIEGAFGAVLLRNGLHMDVVATPKRTPLFSAAFRGRGLHLAIRPFTDDAQATSRVPHRGSQFRLCRFQEVDDRWHENRRLLALDLNDEAQGRTTR